MDYNFKLKNTGNFTTEEVEGKPLNFVIDDKSPIFIGTITHADEDYVYGVFDSNKNSNILIEFIRGELKYE